MSISLINRPCTLIRRSDEGDTDEYGYPVSAETLETTVCEVQQRTRTEPGSEGELSVADWAGYFPAGTNLDSGDAIEVDGLGVFELVGAPWPARNPLTQDESHVEATLRRTAGPESAS